MKIKFLLFSLAIPAATLMAQEPSDALRYSWLTPYGTARSQATGGAMVSLGGDLTATFVNPAGLGFYKTNEFVLTPGYTFGNNKADYLGTEEKDNKSSFNYGASGLIFATPGSRNGNWRNYTFSFALNRVANFNSNTLYEGLNTESSYSEKYLEELINNNVTDPNVAATNFPYGSSLAFNTYLIDTIQGAGGVVDGYRSQSTPYTGVTQKQIIETKGGITDFSIAGSANLKDKFYFGGSISVDVLNFKRNTTFREADATSDPNNHFNYFDNVETLETNGVGVNAKLGIIFKPVDYFRIGLAFHTPTFYNMKDKYTSEITTDLEGYGGPPEIKSQSSTVFNNGFPGEFNYNFVNPLRLMLGLSYVLREVQDVTQQKGFLTADIEYVDYKAANFQSADSYNVGTDNYFNQLNTAIDNAYKAALNARIGGELKFTTLMVRAGFAWYGNPYQDPDIDGSRILLSGGLGYRNKGMFFDLTYVQQLSKYGFYPYRLDQGFYSPVNVKGSTGNVLLTVGFKF